MSDVQILSYSIYATIDKGPSVSLHAKRDEGLLIASNILHYLLNTLSSNTEISHCNNNAIVIQKSPSSLYLNTLAYAFYTLANCYFYQKPKISASKFILNLFLFQNQLHFYQISKKFICDLSTVSRKLLPHYEATKRIAEMHLFPSWQFIKRSSMHFERFNSNMGITSFFRPNHRKLLVNYYMRLLEEKSNDSHMTAT